MRIGLIPNYQKEDIVKALNYIAKLLYDNGHEIYVHEKINPYIENMSLVRNSDKFDYICDLFVAIGGDGTIIHASKHSKGQPIIGVNMGRLGYMAGIEYSDIEQLPELIAGDYIYEDRMLLDVKIGDRLLGKVLNDGVISAKLAKLLDFNVVIDGCDFHYRADGIIVSTPTGSTAYSLSAGGPVVDPNSKCMLLTQICPHSLFNRSIVLSDKTNLKVRVKCKYDETVILTLDGAEPFVVKNDEEITFTGSAEKIRLIMHKKRNFFELVNKKLLIADNSI